MRWTRAFLIVLALLSLGCARGDWTTETLTLVDVTGTWEGLFKMSSTQYPIERAIRWVLKQNGAKVTGEAQEPDGAAIASIEGAVKGEVLDWQLTGPFFRVGGGIGSASSRTYRGEATVNSDELSGRADVGMYCPCTFVLRRVNTDAIRQKQQQM